MLRYFYILVCIQLCFCYDYIDNTHSLSPRRRVRNKNNKIHKKHASSKRSHVVQFDVENFMKRPTEESLDNYAPYGLRNRKRENRRVSANFGDYGSFIGSNDHAKDINKVQDYANVEAHMAGLSTRPTLKDVNPRHFNLHSMSFGDRSDLKAAHGHDKGTTTQSKMAVAEKYLTNDPERKCAFKNMKVPFFSFNKSTMKGKRQKKRKLFCFNCKKPTTVKITDKTNIKSDDEPNKDISDTIDNKGNKVSKRAYQELCPKCIRELLGNLRKKTTKKKTLTATTSHHHETKTMGKEKSTVIEKGDLNDRFENADHLNNVRSKRDDVEKRRRLQELEEVERKIDRVRVTLPRFRNT